MSTADAAGSWELVVGPEGSVPAEQLARLGVAPGAHLRVVSNPGSESTAARKSLAGVLRDRIDDTALDASMPPWQRTGRNASPGSRRRAGSRRLALACLVPLPSRTDVPHICRVITRPLRGSVLGVVEGA